jgi:hypothetical protein
MSTSPFVLPRALRAHPQLDDYVHVLKFSGDGLVEMAAAAGQFVISVARGRCAVQTRGLSVAEVHLHDLVEIDPYRANVEVGRLESRKVVVSREAGPFVFRRPIGATHPEADRPWLLYRQRYEFEPDPLGYASDKSQNNAFYHLIMTRALIESERYYYDRDGGEAASDDQLVALGIKPETLS